MTERWEEPSTTGLLAAFLDPRFKMMTFTTETKKQEVIQALQNKMKEPEQSTIMNNTSHSIMASLFDNSGPAFVSPLDAELEIYQHMPECSKYEAKHELYNKYNPLKWWNDHKNTLPNLAEQA